MKQTFTLGIRNFRLNWVRQGDQVSGSKIGQWPTQNRTMPDTTLKIATTPPFSILRQCFVQFLGLLNIHKNREVRKPIFKRKSWFPEINLFEAVLNEKASETHYFIFPLKICQTVSFLAKSEFLALFLLCGQLLGPEKKIAEGENFCQNRTILLNKFIKIGHDFCVLKPEN